MRTDSELQKDVQDAIRWEPSLNIAEIGVIARDGVITVSGIVNSYTRKLKVEQVVKAVSGVRAVAEDIEIRFENAEKTGDTEIALAVLHALERGLSLPAGKIKVTAEKGWITLEGELQWNYQRETVINAVHHLSGVMGVINNITIKADEADVLEKSAIEHALSRSSSIYSGGVIVNVTAHNVTLSGMVNSIYEKTEAERITWNAPGVHSIDNEIIIGYGDTLLD